MRTSAPGGTNVVSSSPPPAPPRSRSPAHVHLPLNANMRLVGGYRSLAPRTQPEASRSPGGGVGRVGRGVRRGGENFRLAPPQTCQSKPSHNTAKSPWVEPPKIQPLAGCAAGAGMVPAGTPPKKMGRRQKDAPVSRLKFCWEFEKLILIRRLQTITKRRTGDHLKKTLLGNGRVSSWTQRRDQCLNLREMNKILKQQRNEEKNQY